VITSRQWKFISVPKLFFRFGYVVQILAGRPTMLTVLFVYLLSVSTEVTEFLNTVENL
jgi:hypothetical protein